MSWVLSTALAVPFTTTSETFDFVVGGVTYTATIGAATYRINLAPSATDALRVLAAAILAAPGLAAAQPAMTVTVTISATTGLVTIDSNTLFKCTTLHSTTLGKVLGFTAAMGSAALTDTGTRQPWYLGLFVCASGGVWVPKRSGAREKAAGGVVYTFAGSTTHYERELASDLIPWDATRATEAESPATPFYPVPQYLHDVAGVSVATRVWGLVDVWAAAGNVDCALALESWQDVVASTSERFYVGRLSTDLPEPGRQDPLWSRYVTLPWGFVLPTSGQTGTRA